MDKDALNKLLTAEQLGALTEIVAEWIGEGFTTPPYTTAQYDIFEWLGLAENRGFSYDTRRPAPRLVESEEE